MKRELSLAELERGTNYGTFVMETDRGYMFESRGVYMVAPKIGLSSCNGDIMGVCDHDYCFSVPLAADDDADQDADNINWQYQLRGAEYALPPAIARNGSHDLLFGEWKEMSVGDGMTRRVFFAAEEPEDGKHVCAFCYRMSESANPSAQPGLLYSDFATTNDDCYVAIYEVDDSWRLAQQCCQRQYEYDAEVCA